MATTVKTTWSGGMAFDAEIGGHHLIMDADKQWGGQDLGPRPKPLLLAALAGCSGMDIVSILTKMKVPDYKFQIETAAESTSEDPVIYHTITVRFLFWGDNLPPEKLMKAVTLSTERYCGVNAMLKKSANVIVKVLLNDEEVHL